MSMTPDQCFQKFSQQWKSREPVFRLNDEQVREKLMTLMSAGMSLLAVAEPAVFDAFFDECAAVAKRVVPKEIQDKINEAVSST